MIDRFKEAIGLGQSKPKSGSSEEKGAAHPVTQASSKIEQGGGMANIDFEAQRTKLIALRPQKKEVKFDYTKFKGSIEKGGIQSEKNYRDFEEDGREKDKTKQETHKAGEFLEAFANVHESAYALHTPNYASHDFQSICPWYIKNATVLEVKPFYLKTAYSCNVTVITAMLDENSGINNATIHAFNSTYNRKDGKEDLKNYCEKNSKSPGDENCICSLEFLNYAHTTLGSYLIYKGNGTMPLSYRGLDKEAKTATINKEQVQAAGLLFTSLFKIHELTFRKYSPTEFPDNFSKYFKIFLENAKVIEDRINVSLQVFRDQIIEKSKLKGSGVIDYTIDAFFEVLKRADGKDDIIKYCEAHTKSPSDKNAYCNEAAVDYVEALVDEINALQHSSTLET